MPAAETTGTPVAILGLTSGEAPLVVRGRPPSEAAGPTGEAQPSGGTIFTELTMPSLEELLEQNRVATATLLAPRELADVSSIVARIAAASAIASGVTVAGAVLTVLSLLSTPAQPDPFVGIGLLLGGVGLIITLLVALRRHRRA